MTTEMVDWQFAVTLGSWLAGAGPEVDAEQAAAVVGELRDGAVRSTSYVREFVGLDAGVDTAPVLVVDRHDWIQANADGFSALLAPIIEKVTQRKGSPPGPMITAVGSRITAAEVGALLGFMASRVLGQFDPFHEPHGRLLLVAPNVVHVERELDVDPHDFRLWVCLHEETHRVQFTAVPWMREHLFSLVNALADTIEPSRLLEGLQRIGESLRSGRSGSLLDLMGTEEQKAILDQVTAVMSLLEGHADYVMDGVGPDVIPSVATIRARFNERRKGAGSLDRLVRRLLGFEAKMAQYREGAAFVRGVVDKVGMTDFNAVWASPDNLPTRDDIRDPSAWIARVLP